MSFRTDYPWLARSRIRSSRWVLVVIPGLLPASRGALPERRLPFSEGEGISLFAAGVGTGLGEPSPHIGQQVIQGREFPTLSRVPSEDQGAGHQALFLIMISAKRVALISLNHFESSFARLTEPPGRYRCFWRDVRMAEAAS